MKDRITNALMVMLVVTPLALLTYGQARAASTAVGGSTDKAVALMVAGEIAHDSLLKDMPIGVADYMGAITLSGAVYTPQQKTQATEVAQSVNGVRKVNNLLEVVEPMVR